MVLGEDKYVYGMTSDQVALVLTMVEMQSGRKPFHYYNSWLKIDGFNAVFREVW